MPYQVMRSYEFGCQSYELKGPGYELKGQSYEFRVKVMNLFKKLRELVTLEVFHPTATSYEYS